MTFEPKIAWLVRMSRFWRLYHSITRRRIVSWSYRCLTCLNETHLTESSCWYKSDLPTLFLACFFLSHQALHIIVTTLDLAAASKTGSWSCCKFESSHFRGGKVRSIDLQPLIHFSSRPTASTYHLPSHNSTIDPKVCFHFHHVGWPGTLLCMYLPCYSELSNATRPAVSVIEVQFVPQAVSPVLRIKTAMYLFRLTIVKTDRGSLCLLIHVLGTQTH